MRRNIVSSRNEVFPRLKNTIVMGLKSTRDTIIGTNRLACVVHALDPPKRTKIFPYLVALQFL